MAPDLRALEIADEPASWIDAGFSVTGSTTTIGPVAVNLAGRTPGGGITGWSLSDVVAGSIDGLATAGTSDTDSSDHPDGPDGTQIGGPQMHPNGVEAIDHVVVSSPDLSRTVAALEQAGMTAKRTRDTEMGGEALRQVFFRMGRPILELIGPPESNGDGPATFWGLALTVGDLDASVAHLGPLIGEPREAVQPGRRIATLRTRDLDISVPIAFMST
jgi:hypothetical protein